MERESTGLYMMSHDVHDVHAFLCLLAFAVWLYVYRAQVELC